MKILSTLVLPTAGLARIHGHDVVTEGGEVRKLVGLISADERSFYWRLTGRQNLEFFAALYHLRGSQSRRRIDQLLALLNLTEAANQRFQAYSTGMRQKMAIARGLLADPKVLLVDEPTRSLDPVSALAVRQFLKMMVAAEGRTVLLATHQMAEAEQLCDRIAIIDRGRVSACGTVGELSLTHHRERCRLEVENLEERQWQGIARIPGVTELRKIGHTNGVVAFEVTMESSRAVLPNVIATIVSAGGAVRACNMREATLEEVFTSVIGAEHNSAEQSNGVEHKQKGAVV
jgi:ABC-2 type transport system ATP-binding protein